MSIKIESGNIPGRTETVINHFKTKEEAGKKAIQVMRNQLARGYKRRNDKFVYEFTSVSTPTKVNLYPDIQSDGTEEMLEEIESPLEIEETKEISTVKRLSSYRNIGDMLKSVHLERFQHIFDEERIDSDEFLTMEDADFAKLDIPPSARRTILDSIHQGRWLPTNSPMPAKKLKYD
jgi:hypothetical protein